MMEDVRASESSSPTLHSLKWLWGILRHHRLQVVLNTVLGCSTVALDFIFISITKWAIDIATHKAEGQLSVAAVALTAILVTQLCIGYASRWIKAILGVKAQNRMQLVFFDRMLHSEWKERMQRHSGDILNRLERDVTDVVNAVTETVPSIVSVCVRLVGAFIFLYTMDSTLACLTIVIIPLFMALSKVYMKRMRRLTREIRNTDSQIQSLLQESIQHQTIVQTMEQQPALTHRLDRIQQHLRDQVKNRTRFSSASASLLSAGFMGCYLIAFLWGVNRLHEGAITYGMLTAFIQLVGQIQGPFRDMTRFIPILVNSFTASERLMQLEEIPLEKVTQAAEQNATAGVRFSHVSYNYEKGGRTVLQDFSYDFPPGSHTVVVGETGAGKTTMIRLMLSLIQPSKGGITLYDGQGGQTACSAATRNHFTYVPQGNSLFSGTIRDNLLLGNPHATDEEMKTALEHACADFVLRMPQGLDSRCGEQGIGLSEGQAQRIAIARALLRKGGILLLDEATSSLDIKTETQLWEHIRLYYADKTIIFVTHRTGVITPETRVLQIVRHSSPATGA